VKQQNVQSTVTDHLTGGDTKELHATAASNVVAPPEFVTQRVAVTNEQRHTDGYTVQPGDTSASVSRRTGVPADQVGPVQPGQKVNTATSIPITTTQRSTQNATVTQQQAANNNSRVVPDVTIASGKTVPVGTMGTSNGGKYVYQVQADGSVKELNSGRTTAPAPSKSSRA
jgi:spore germination protein YaaH